MSLPSYLSLYCSVIVLRAKHLGFVPFFFPMQFLRKVWTSGRINEYDITFWKAPQNSCLGPKRLVFACLQARAYGVRSEVESVGGGVRSEVEPMSERVF